MSAQFLMSYNETAHQFQVLGDSSFVDSEEERGERFVGSASVSNPESAESKVKQREALYYIVAVIAFYAFTFLFLFFKYARFKKRELDDVIPYFSLPPDATNLSTYPGVKNRVPPSRSPSSALLKILSTRKASVDKTYTENTGYTDNTGYTENTGYTDSTGYTDKPTDKHDSGQVPSTSHPEEEGDQLAFRTHGARDRNYGSNDVTAKVMRVKMAPHWLCRKEHNEPCDV